MQLWVGTTGSGGTTMSAALYALQVQQKYTKKKSLQGGGHWIWFLLKIGRASLNAFDKREISI